MTSYCRNRYFIMNSYSLLKITRSVVNVHHLHCLILRDNFVIPINHFHVLSISKVSLLVWPITWTFDSCNLISLIHSLQVP